MVGFVVVVLETRTESTRAVISTWIELFWEPPLLVEAAIIGKLGQGLLKEAVTLQAGALLTSMAVLVHNTISKFVVFVTVIIIHKITIGVGFLQGEGLHLDVGLEVGVVEGGGQGADVGGPGRQLAAVIGDQDHRNSGPRLRDGDTWAGSVLRPGREAWR